MHGQSIPSTCLGCRAELEPGTTGMCPACKNERETAWRASRSVPEIMRQRAEARDADPRRTHQCPLCIRRFISEESLGQHINDRHTVKTDV